MSNKFIPKISNPRFNELVGNTFELEELFDKAIWAEGPAWSKPQQALYFSDVKVAQCTAGQSKMVHRFSASRLIFLTAMRLMQTTT